MNVIIPVPIKEASINQIVEYETQLKAKREFYKGKPRMATITRRNLIEYINKELKEIDFQLIRRGQRISAEYKENKGECDHWPKSAKDLTCMYCGQPVKHDGDKGMFERFVIDETKCVRSK